MTKLDGCIYCPGALPLGIVKWRNGARLGGVTSYVKWRGFVP